MMIQLRDSKKPPLIKFSHLLTQGQLRMRTIQAPSSFLNFKKLRTSAVHLPVQLSSTVT
jgi:hypothetical protein